MPWFQPAGTRCSVRRSAVGTGPRASRMLVRRGDAPSHVGLGGELGHPRHDVPGPDGARRPERLLEHGCAHRRPGDAVRVAQEDLCSPNRVVVVAERAPAERRASPPRWAPSSGTRRTAGAGRHRASRTGCQRRSSSWRSAVRTITLVCTPNSRSTRSSSVRSTAAGERFVLTSTMLPLWRCVRTSVNPASASAGRERHPSARG